MPFFGVVVINQIDLSGHNHQLAKNLTKEYNNNQLKKNNNSHYLINEK